MCQRLEGIDYHSPEGGKKSVTVRECSVTAILAAVFSLLYLSLSHTGKIRDASARKAVEEMTRSRDVNFGNTAPGISRREPSALDLSPPPHAYAHARARTHA